MKFYGEDMNELAPEDWRSATYILVTDKVELTKHNLRNRCELWTYGIDELGAYVFDTEAQRYISIPKMQDILKTRIDLLNDVMWRMSKAVLKEE